MTEPTRREQCLTDVVDDVVEFYRALTAEQVTEGIANAIKAKDFEAAVSLLKVLAVKDPHQAEIVYGSMMAVLEAPSATTT